MSSAPVERLDSIEQLGAILLGCEQQVISADYSEPLEAFQQTIAEGERQAFESESDPAGNKWAPLAPSTNKRKGYSRILFETGDLMASLVVVGGPGNINETSPKRLVFGTDIEYASFLQDGTSKMPARPPVGMSEETLDKFVNMIADETVGKLKLTR